MKLYISITITLIVFLTILAMPSNLKSQLMNGYEYSYDNGSSATTGNGNRTKRTYKLVLLKSSDSSRTESALGKFDIQIFPKCNKTLCLNWLL